MKIGIVGDATRGVAWEQHLRPHNIIRQVDLCPSIHEMGEVDACFILDESADNLSILLEAVQRGYHSFFIAKQPTDIKTLERIHRAGKESGSLIQFAQWPSLAPATRWMMDKIPRPTYMQINREVPHNFSGNSLDDFQNLWIDELGLCMKWQNSGIHHIEAKEISLSELQPVLAHLFLRFDNGASASIHIYAAASNQVHIRIISNKKEVVECNVREQTVKHGRVGDNKHLFFEKQIFDPAKAAEKAALLFLKSIQLGKETGYTSYDALQLAIQTDRVKSRLKQF